MCIHVQNLVRFLPKKLLNKSEYSVLIELANFADLNEKRKIFPSYQTIGDMTRSSRRTAMRSILNLEKKGYLLKTRIITEKKGNCSNNYKFNLEKLKEESSYKIPVDKSVNNPVENTTPGDNLTPQKSNFCHNPGVKLSPNKIIDHDHRSLKDHNDWKQDDPYLKVQLVEILITLRVCKKDIPIWVRDYGVEKIFSKLSEMKQIQMSSKIAIHNPGAYLRKLLEGERKVA